MATAPASFKQKEINTISKPISLKNNKLLQAASPQPFSKEKEDEDHDYFDVLVQQVLASTLEAEQAVDSALTFIAQSNQRIEKLFRRDLSWA